MKSRFLILVGSAVVVLSIQHVDELTLLLGSGALGILWQNRHRLKGAGSAILAVAAISFVPMIQVASSAAAVSGTPTLSGLGLFFLKVGSVLYGSGYVLVAFLQGGLVDARHWLTQTQLLAAVALWKVNAAWIVAASALLSWMFSLLHL